MSREKRKQTYRKYPHLILNNHEQTTFVLVFTYYLTYTENIYINFSNVTYLFV